MDLYEVIDQVAALLQQRKRVAYRSLKVQFQLDDESLEALKEELIEVLEIATDKGGKMLVWTGSETPEELASQTADAPAAESPPPAPSAFRGRFFGSLRAKEQLLGPDYVQKFL